MSADQHFSACPHWLPGNHGFDASYSCAKCRREGPSTLQVPCFPYTETPILPQVLYRAGLSSKEGLQEHDSVDPILVVKFPRMLRGPPGRYLRSTWILREGQWHQMEDHAQLHDTPAKFDRYVERAVFQFHPVRGQLRAAAVSEVHLSPVPEHPPLGQCFVRALAGETRNGPRLSRMCGNIWR